VERVLARANRLFDRHAHELGDEFRERRVTIGMSQAQIASAARVPRNRYGRIENGRCPNLTLAEIERIASVLGLDASVRAYPAGPSVRDAGQARKLSSFLSLVHPPLASRTEVSLPIVEGRPDRRAWDAVVFNGRARCAIELEMRLRDVQALLRRIDLKRRDDPTERFVLLIADTRRNRLVLAEFAAMFVDLPRRRPSDVRAALSAGQLPRTGLLLV